MRIPITEAIHWAQLIHSFKEHKLSSGAIKQSTWNEIYWRMVVILDAVGGKQRPLSLKQLLQTMTESLKDRAGSHAWQLQVQFTAA
jgi:hypothetical protein